VGAKEAVAVALEMRGDRTALDTLRVARRMAVDEQMKLRLAVADVLMQLKFVDPSAVEAVGAIGRFADSLLASHPRPDPVTAAQLASLAMLRGQCERGGQLSAVARALVEPGIPGDIIGDADALAVRLVGGCAVDPRAEIARLRKRIETTAGARRDAVNSLLARPAQLMEGRDPALLEDFTRRTSGYLLRAQGAARRGHPDSVVAILARVDSSRQRSGYADVTPDAVLLEARLYLDIGDTTAAVAELDRLFDRLPTITPGLLNKAVAMGGLMRSLRLRADLEKSPLVRPSKWSTLADALSAPR
jgi:hypothetical protein